MCDFETVQLPPRLSLLMYVKEKWLNHSVGNTEDSYIHL